MLKIELKHQKRGNKRSVVDFFENFTYTSFYNLKNVKKHGPIAQLVEQRVCNAKVSGSNPLWSTIMSSTERWNFCFKDLVKSSENDTIHLTIDYMSFMIREQTIRQKIRVWRADGRAGFLDPKPDLTWRPLTWVYHMKWKIPSS